MYLKIDFYSNSACPWCLIGQHRLDTVLASHFPSLEVDIVHHPVVLMPDLAPEGLRIADVMKARGLDPLLIRARPEAEARAVGLVLDLSRQTMLYPTLAAQTLIRLARERGTQHALAKAIAKANFDDVRNIADADVLADIATRYGFEHAEAKQLVSSPAELERTRAAAAEASSKGIRSVPHFVFNDLVLLNGHQSEAAFVEAIRRATTATSDERVEV